MELDKSHVKETFEVTVNRNEDVIYVLLIS